MVSYEQEDAVEVVHRALSGQRPADEQTLASAAVLVERLTRIQQLGGLFEQVSFSPRMQAMMSGQFAAAAECAV
jgi:hypothetical protein